METQIAGVHSDSTSFEETLRRLKGITQERAQYEVRNTSESVIERLQRNLQYNSSPAVSYLKVGKEDAKIIIELLEKIQSEE